MTTGWVRGISPQAKLYVATNMRREDKAEAWAHSRSDPFEAIELSAKLSQHLYTGVFEDVPVCVFGVGSISVATGTGCPWLLGTNLIDDHKKEFLRQSVKMRDKMLRKYRRLLNVVHDEHKSSKRWLRWLGAELGPPIPLGPAGEQFRRFIMERK